MIYGDRMLLKIWRKQEFRFLFVGGLNTLFGYGLYAILLFLNINYLVANTISTVLGVGHSYLWNRFFTFKSKEKAGKELLKFISVYIISYILGTITLFTFKSVLNISPYIAGLLNLVITTLISWFGHKNFSFNNEKKDLKTQIKKSLKYIIPCALFLITFTLLLMFKNISDFTDEGDVMLAATMLSKGKLIYIDFASQHLPFTYYIFAPFALMGVKSVLGFRISMYFLLSLIWVLIYLRYKKFFNHWILLAYPFCYILMMAISPFVNATVISEQIEAQCLVILMLELFQFVSTKTLDWKSKVIIPSVMVLSIGCAFVSIIPCFIIVLSFLYLDIKNEKRKKKLNLLNYLSHFWKEYKLIILVGFGLIFLFLGYLTITGSLKECYDQAFKLNTEVYSKYNNYASNPLKTILLIIPKFLMTVQNYFQINSWSIIHIIIWIGTIFLTLKIAKEDFILGLAILLFITLCGNRGFEGFHALPYYAVASLGTLFLIEKQNKKIIMGSILIFSLFFIKVTSPYLENIYKPKEVNEPYYQLINKIFSEDEIFHIDINTTEYINAGKTSASRFSGLVPWFSEVYEKDLLNEIKVKNPRALFYHPYHDVWGYLFKDFAPNINSYILENYTYMNQLNIWLRKDAMNTIEQELDMDIAEYDNNFNNKTVINLKNNIIEQSIQSEQTITKIGLKFGTYNRSNYSLIQMEILESNKIIYNEQLSANELKDNEIYLINLEKTPLKENHEYRIKITSSFTNENDFVAIYKVSDEFQLDHNQLIVNGVTYEEDLAMVMYYEEKNN